MAKLDKLIGKSHEHLEPGEQVEAAVMGAYETEIMGQDSVRNGVLLATDRRLVFYAKKLTGYDLESFPYENISSFEQGKNMMGSNIKFFASGNKVSVKWIKKGELDELVNYVKSRMGKVGDGAGGGTASGAATQSIPDQIEKLAELRDAGVLTDDEFDAKKTELLDRM